MPTRTKKPEPILWTESKLGPTAKERKVAEVTGRRGEIAATGNCQKTAFVSSHGDNFLSNF